MKKTTDPNSPAAETSDAGYRRGSVLGLTLAEVFILLLFLLLLALLVSMRDWRKREEELERQLEALAPWQAIHKEFETPDEVLTLRQRKGELEDEVDRLHDLVQADDPTKRALDALERERQAREEVERQLNLRRKGENPPCWYETVHKRKGGTREKPHYAFNIAVFDQHMIALPVSPPPGGAVDDGDGSYADEAAKLNFNALPYGVPLDNASMQRIFAHVSKAGTSGNVRSYPCVFFVRVWDKTSANAKARWKTAKEDILEGLFGTYTVRDDPFPQP